MDIHQQNKGQTNRRILSNIFYSLAFVAIFSCICIKFLDVYRHTHAKPAQHKKAEATALTKQKMLNEPTVQKNKQQKIYAQKQENLKRKPVSSEKSAAIKKKDNTPEIVLPSIEHDPTNSAFLAKETTPLLETANKNITDLSSQEKNLRSNNMAPSIPLSLSNGELSASVSPNATAVDYRDQSVLMRAHIGLGYSADQGNRQLNGQYTMGFSSAYTAIGTQLLFLPDMKDIAVMGVHYLPEKQLRLKAAANYLWGRQSFLFSSGCEARELSQMGLFVSGDHTFPEDQYPWLHTLGVSSWISSTQEDGAPSADSSYLVETQDHYDLYNDTKKLSLGQLIGSSVDLQVSPQDRIVMKVSLGYEQVNFPLLGDRNEINRTLYQAIKLDYEPVDHLIVGTEYKKGSTETRVGIRADMHGLGLMLYQNWGLNGIQGHKGAMLSYNLTSWSKEQHQPLAKRMRPSAAQGKLGLLSDATVRPLELPLTFMAKIDPGSHKNFASIDKAGLGTSDVTITQGQIMVRLPNESIASISSITMSGSSGSITLSQPTDYATTQANVVIVNISALQAQIPAPGDYEFTINVSGDTNYTIHIKTSLQTDS